MSRSIGKIAAVMNTSDLSHRGGEMSLPIILTSQAISKASPIRFCESLESEPLQAHTTTPIGPNQSHSTRISTRYEPPADVLWVLRVAKEQAAIRRPQGRHRTLA